MEGPTGVGEERIPDGRPQDARTEQSDLASRHPATCGDPHALLGSVPRRVLGFALVGSPALAVGSPVWAAGRSAMAPRTLFCDQSLNDLVDTTSHCATIRNST